VSLLITARWRALKHVRGIFPRKGCRIWRMYSCFGLRTHAVFCSCGEIFGTDQRGTIYFATRRSHG
jgi:hypothetical protein